MGVPNANPETHSYSVPAGTTIFGSGGQPASLETLTGKTVDAQTDGVVAVNIFVG